MNDGVLNDPTAPGFDLKASMAEADRILALAGWRPPFVWAGQGGLELNEDGAFARANLVGGYPPGSENLYIKDWAKISPTMRERARAIGADFDSANPDTPHEAAQWLVDNVSRGATAKRYRYKRKARGEPPQADPEPAPAPVEAAPESPPAQEDEESVSRETEGERSVADITDAEFADFGDLPALEDTPMEIGVGDDLPALPEPDPLDFAPDEIEREDGPIAYAASDLDALVREKMGRISQIARELKARLQDGWDVGGYASLQNLIVRIERREAPDDPEARARFAVISERSQAMSRVDAHRDAMEAALEEIGRARDYRAAVEFDPEAGWP